MRAPHIIAVAMLLAAITVAAAAARAENNTATNTTAIENVTLPVMPNITALTGAEATVSATRGDNAVTIHYACYYTSSPSQCPPARYVLSVENTSTVLFNQTYAVDPSSDCRSNTCSYSIDVAVPTDYANATLLLSYQLLYANMTVSKTLRLPPPMPGWTRLAALLPVIVAVGFGIQYSLSGAAVGLIAGVAVSYLLSMAGLAPQEPLLYYVAIVMAAALLVASRD